MRKTISIFFGVMLAGNLIGCGGDDCEKAADQISAKYEECGVPVADGGDATGDAECTDEAGTAALCVADCTDGADCSLLDGSATDLDALGVFADCVVGCAGSGTTGTTTTTTTTTR